MRMLVIVIIIANKYCYVNNKIGAKSTKYRNKQ